ncbi:hypothetical protein IAR55_005999 [Kwoniella newhampshirensis]|uniref:FAD-binding PCMH-type domain-containing protein n=1 Tax=Kwoniella newhampshirensis TaxID=1651941 RepID=A0AAW0YFX0_9TREE
MTLSSAEEFGFPLVKPSDDKYEFYRMGRNFSTNDVKRQVAGVAVPRTVDEVIAAVQHAGRNNLTIGVRSGGHSFNAPAVRDNALLIDLIQLKEVSFDEETEIVTASPSSTGKIVNGYLKSKGYWFPGGHCDGVGLGGFLSQGGAGFMWRSIGWAASLIEWMDVVTADGRLVHVSHHENTELLWAFVGSGPGYFGVVVRFGLKCPKLSKHHLRSVLLFGQSEYKDVMKWCLDIGETVAPSTEMFASSILREKFLPGGDPKEALLRVQCSAWTDSFEAGQAILTFMESAPHLDKAYHTEFCQPASLEAEYQVQIDINPVGQYFVTNGWFAGDHGRVTDLLEKPFLTLPSADSYSMMYSMQPRMSRHHFANDISSGIYVISYAIAADSDETPDLADKCKTWIQDTWRPIDEASREAAASGDPSAPRSVGYYTGDCNQEIRPGRFMSEQNWVKWVGIRDRYDPSHRFVGYLNNTEFTLNWNAWEGAPPANRPV